ncbi:MAG: glucose 1-dehydrogenase [Deltaproteobacteria bacterium]|nr:glucose 1-dehydrogenase [Deltaproteobacteria bacterium]
MSDMFRLDDKVVVVIGGTGGIGELMAEGLANQGAKLAIAGTNQEKLKRISANIQKNTGSETIGFQVDVADPDSVVQLAEDVKARFGTVDVLVNTQGLNYKHPATEFPVDQWDKMFGVNVKGVMLACREFGKIMIANQKGKVINLSSVRGVRATLWGGNEGYCGTKGAVDMMTRSLASEWAEHNINVNAIGPSLIRTPLAEKTLNDPERLAVYLANVPLKRVGEPKDLVGLCVFLASPASDFITGQIIYLDGGLTAIG